MSIQLFFYTNIQTPHSSPIPRPNATTTHCPQVCYQPQNDAPSFKELSADTVALVVDGPALMHILGDPEYEAMFLRLSTICRSVVACRVSPAQKRQIVRCVCVRCVCIVSLGIGWVAGWLYGRSDGPALVHSSQRQTHTHTHMHATQTGWLRRV